MYGAAAGVCTSPTLTWTCIRRFPVGPHRVTVDEGMGNGRTRLKLRKTEQSGDDGGGGNLDKDDVVDPAGVEGVAELQHALDLVSFDQG